MLGFFHQRIRERVHAFQERGALGGGERRERIGKRAVAIGEPFAYLRCGLVVEPQHGAAPIVRVLGADEQARRLEVARELARGRQREPDRVGHVAHGRPVGGRDEGEDADMPSAEAASERRAAPPDAAQHPPQLAAQLGDLVR